MRRALPTFTLAVGLFASGTTCRAWAGDAARLVLAGRVDAVAAAGAGVAALRGGEVLVLDGDGRVFGGCRNGDAAGARPRPDRTTRSSEEVLTEAGFSAEDVSPEAEDLLEDEGIDPPSRWRPMDARAGVPRARALAATPDVAWIGTVDGLWRLDLAAGACAPAGLGGQEISLVAAQGTTVVAVADVTVWRSRDAGATFDVAAVLTSPAHALALAADEETLVLADDDGVVEVGAARGLRRRLEGRVDALAACGSAVVALADDGVHRLDLDGGDALAGDRPPARALACGVDGLVAVGVGVWTSVDGASWREAAEGLGRSFSGVACAAGHPWLAGEDGLAVLARTADDEPSLGLEARPGRRLVEERRPPAWAGLLPRVAVTFDRWTTSRDVAGWQLWVRLIVSLGRRQRMTNENPEDL